MSRIEYKLFRTKQSNSLDTNIQVNHFYILVEFVSNLYELNDKEIDSIWFNRQNGQVTARKIKSVKEYDEIGKVYGYIGKFQINSNFKPRLLFIKKYETVGSIRVKSRDHVIYKIKEILVVTLNPYSNSVKEDDFLTTFETNNENENSISLISLNLPNSNSFLKSPSFPTIQQLLDSPMINLNKGQQKSPQTESNSTVNTNTVLSNSPSPLPSNNPISKFEKKIIDEIIKIFQENGGSFYFSFSFDLTNSIERQEDYLQTLKLIESSNNNSDLVKNIVDSSTHWRRADDRFFWNKVLLNDIIQLNADYEILKYENETDKSAIIDLDKFILPLIQGFFQIEILDIPVEDSLTSKNIDSIKLKLCLISRRNRFRLGTRFKSRGIDENGNVSNFVETEQIVEVYDGHTLSSVLLRGSIPVFWSQPGLKYRPPPQLDRTELENKTAIDLHFNKLEVNYPHHSKLVVINLVEEFGKESIIGDAFVKYLAEMDRNNLVYVQFDFHEHCKGLKFDNVSILKEKIKHLICDDIYSWIDNKGFIFRQKTYFRVNCVDCLDRTNVVQMVIAKSALEHQLARLGLIIPPAELPIEFKKKFLSLWANNGDAISQQYAGTDALKGDYTRTGERNLTGMMKDGMKSANRFYLRFKDNNRQMALEVLQGIKISDEESNGQNNNIKNLTNLLTNLQKEENASNLNNPNIIVDEKEREAQKEREENIRQLIADCKKLLVDLNEDCYGNWALIDHSNTYDPNQVDPDVVVLFTSTALYIANYDDTNETFSDYQKIDLKNIEKLELGPEPTTNQFFKSNTLPRFDIMRIYYKTKEGSAVQLETNDNESSSSQTENFHTFRSCNLRFFNNLVITTNSNDEMTEALRGICHTIQSTAAHFGYNIAYEETKKLLKKRSKPHPNFIRLSRLSTKMSIDESFIKSNNQTQFNVKLNKIGKLIGNKFYSIVNNQNQESQSSSTSSSSSSSFSSNSTSSNNDNLNSKLNITPDTATTSTNEASKISALKSVASSSSLSTNRSNKLKDLNKLIEKNQNTKFIFI